MPTRRQHLNFFIDYVDVDLPWAEWVAWQLEKAEYTVKYRHRFQPGTNVVQETNDAVIEAEHVLALFSPDYLRADRVGASNGIPVWTTALYNDATGKKRKLLPVRVRPCRPDGLLQPIQRIDLVSLNESLARKALLDGVSEKRREDNVAPPYPGATQAQPTNASVPGFPATYRPAFWNIPHYNPFFTDREAVLAELYEQLNTGQQGTIHTYLINGLGGIGKTQVALAYAHGYKQCYQTALWINASNENECIKSMRSLLKTLQPELPKTAYQNRQAVKATIKQWLEQHEHWLLIVDNIADPQLLRDFIPTIGNGHVLCTTQMQAAGGMAAARLSLRELQQEDGALFLLRRARGQANALFDHTTEPDWSTALKLARKLGNLPLMLDQAGAYIEEKGTNIAEYLEYYQNNLWRHDLLHKRGDATFDYHRESVFETYNHAFLALQNENANENAKAAAYDLLCLCSFLDHKAIPIEIVSQGAAGFLPTLQPFGDSTPTRYEAFAILRKYSLLNRQRDHTTREWLSMNPVVQEVLKDGMSQDEQRMWAERAIRAVCCALPEPTSACLHYIPHVRTCAEYMKVWKIICQEGSQLLYHMGKRLYQYHQQAHIEEQKHIIEALKYYSTLLAELDHEKAEELTGYLDTLHQPGTSGA